MNYNNRTTMTEDVRIAGALYAKALDGSLHRISPERPYRGKSERRSVIKARREAKRAQ